METQMSKRKKDSETRGAHRCKVRVKHKFSNEELLERSSLAAKTHQDIELKEEAVKAASSVAKSEIKQLKSDLSEILNTLRNGSEEREVDAMVEYNPKKGTKKFYHFAPGKPHNKEFIEEKAMQEEDYQLPGMEETFGEQPKPEVPAPKANEEEEPPAVHSADETKREDEESELV
jgi:hypothetical protein